MGKSPKLLYSHPRVSVSISRVSNVFHRECRRTSKYRDYDCKISFYRFGEQPDNVLSLSGYLRAFRSLLYVFAGNIRAREMGKEKAKAEGKSSKLLSHKHHLFKLSSF